MNRNFRHFLISLASITLIATSAACAPTKESASTRSSQEGTGERVGEYIDDSVITAKVKAALVDDPELSAIEVNVETYRGVVQLSGFVKDAGDIARATKVARKVNGVQDVKNDLRLKQSAE